MQNEIDYYSLSVNELLSLASNGDAFAQYLIGYYYEIGHGVTKSYTEAIKWYMSAVEGNEANAMNALGVLYLNGKGISQNTSRANELFMKAAEYGVYDALGNLADSYFLGRGLRQDYLEAFNLYSQAIKSGNSNTFTALGNCYYNGYGTDVNYKRAVVLFTKAVEDGNALAMYYLGNAYFDGKGCDKDINYAIDLYQQSANSGNKDADYRLGQLIFEGKYVQQDKETAIYFLFEAFKLGKSEAADLLAKVHYSLACDLKKTDFKGSALNFEKSINYGNFECKKEAAVAFYNYACKLYKTNEFELANDYLTKAKKEGYPPAINKLAYAYINGIGYPVDIDYGIELYKKSADLGSDVAQYNLGVFFENGKYVEYDIEQAIKYFEMAKTQNNERASLELGRAYAVYGLTFMKKKNYQQALDWFNKGMQCRHYFAFRCIANCYEEGKGVSKSFEEALKYYELAKKLGDKECDEKIQLMEKKAKKR